MADMICQLGIRIELAIEAKGILMLKKQGYRRAAPRRADTRVRFMKMTNR